MPKNDNAHAIRIYNSLAELSVEAAEEFAGAHPLSKSADYKKRFAWARAQCAFLEERFTPEEIAAVRARCHCEAGSALAGRMRRYFEQTGSLGEFAAMFNEREKYVAFEAVPGGLLLIYPECYCACVKRVEEPVSRSWCLCTLGHVRGLFYQALGHEVQVELLESIKTGGSRCLIKITL